MKINRFILYFAFGLCISSCNNYAQTKQISDKTFEHSNVSSPSIPFGTATLGPDIYGIRFAFGAFSVDADRRIVGSLGGFPFTAIPEKYIDNGYDYFRSPWTNHNISEMRFCTSIDIPCKLDEAEWIPFSEFYVQELVVYWVGVHHLIISIEFRDNQKHTVPIIRFSYFSKRVEYEEYSIATEYLIEEGVLDIRTPPSKLPIPAQTEIAVTSIAFPVQGSVTIIPRSLTGKDLTIVDIPVLFSATSPFGKVTKMRTSYDGKWEPFTPQKSFAYEFRGLSSFYICVEYMDEFNNLSPKYCDSIDTEATLS